MKRATLFASLLIATLVFAISYNFLVDSSIGANAKSILLGFPRNDPAARTKPQQLPTGTPTLADDVLLDIALKYPELINRKYPSAPRLIIPVKGVSAYSLVDTFTASRSNGRIHEAIDIMAPTGTPVIAAIDGTVAKLFASGDGGLSLYQIDSNKTHVYYYAHLDDYSKGLANGKRIHQGEVIGYVGYTGNANSDAPHLHFAIFKLEGSTHWWKGNALNPYPWLALE